jgi:glycosyltransferase involved in cell wall biosynthesis
MNIVLVNHYAGSPEHGMEFRPHQFARRWVKDGHDVTILAASFSHLRNRNPSVQGRSREEFIDGIRYRWLKTPRYLGNGLARIRSIHAFLRGIDRERRGFLSDRRVDAVIASSTYPFDIDPCRRLASDRNATLVWEVHDLWPLSPIELSGFSPKHPFIRITQRAEDRCCRDAELVVSILPRAIDHLRTRGLDPDRYIYVPNGAEAEPGSSGSSGKTKETEIIASHQAAGRFTVVYAGGHGQYHALGDLISAAIRLPSKDFAFVLIGDGPHKANLRELASRHPDVKIDFLDRVPRSIAMDALRQGDAIFAGLAEHSLFRFGIGPNKIFDGMLAGRPIVAAYSAGNDPVREAGCGLSVPASDVDALVAAMVRLHGLDPEARKRMGEAGESHVRRHHDYGDLARRFIAAIESTRAGSDSGAGS